MKNRLLFFLVIFSMFSCTKLINIDFGKQDSKLVVNSIFTDDDVIKLTLSKTLSFAENGNDRVDNAECKLFCDDEFVEILENKGGGNYESITIAEKEKTYKIEISCEGFETVTAESFIPTMPTFFRYDSMPSAIWDEGDGLGVYYTNAGLTILDDDHSDNFYSVKLYNEYYDGTQVNPIHRYRSDDPVLVNEGILTYQPMFLLFSDKLLDEQERQIKYQHAAVGMFGDTSLLIIQKKSITEDYYKYLKSVIIQANNQASQSNILLIGEPIEIYTNIKNGYGIFAGVAIDYDTLVIDKWL